MISSIGKIVLKKSVSYCNKAKNYYICALKHGKVSEWSNEQSWKDCIRDDCIEGSNPSLSAERRATVKSCSFAFKGTFLFFILYKF